MQKVLTIAKNEYVIAVTSKAFVAGVLMMPIMMGGVFAVQHFTRDQVDLAPRVLAVVDRTGEMSDAIEAAAKFRNETMIFEGEGDERKQTDAEFIIERIAEDNASGDVRLDQSLSDRVKQGEIFAFAILEKDLLASDSRSSVQYYSESPSYRALPNWLDRVVNSQIKLKRSIELGLSPEQVAQLSGSTQIKQFGLVQTNQDGEVVDAKEDNKVVTFAVPFVGLMLMFMMLMSVAPAMLNNVLEEKMQKISEFLISSVTPFQLMLGKLIGAIWVGLTLSAIYLTAGYGLAVYFDVAQEIPLSIYAWFIFFLFFALVIFGSMFSAVGAACSEIRDAQSLMTPIMLMVVLPMMTMGPILNSPSSLFARAASLFPPATPMLMFLRIAIPPGPELWEVALGAVLTVLFAIACVWAAGKIFRIGILSQGQSPSVAQLIRWIWNS